MNNDLDGILLFLDFEKAFDSVEYNFMYKALEKFNFRMKNRKAIPSQIIRSKIFRLGSLGKLLI